MGILITRTSIAEEVGEALFEDSFDGGQFNNAGGWAWQFGGSNGSIVASTLCGTTHCVRLRHPFEAVPGDGTSSELRLSFGGEYSEIWWKYYVHIPSNYSHRNNTAANNKGWFTCWEGDYGSPNVGYEPNFWPNGDGSSKQSVYVWGNNDIGDEHFGPSSYPEYFPPSGNTLGIEIADRNKVLEVVGQYKQATSANNDGVVRVWKRRRTATTCELESDWIDLIDISDLNSYSVGQTGFDDSYIFGWHNSGYDEQTDFHFSQMSFATSNIYGAP